MIELFSRKQDIFEGDRASTFIPIAIDEEVSSLSAILLDDSYYHFLKSGRKQVNGMSVLKPTHLIAFKARAYVDLMEKKLAGKHINSDDIKKHRNDIFRLIQLLTGDERLDVEERIKEDIQNFFALVGTSNFDIKDLHLPYNLEEAVEIIANVFGISNEG